jgi:hypothetical protein
MDFGEPWQLLEPATREWLVAHNGEPLTPTVASEITAASTATNSGSWIQDSPDGPVLTDAAVDWIEAAANDE